MKTADDLIQEQLATFKRAPEKPAKPLRGLGSYERGDRVTHPTKGKGTVHYTGSAPGARGPMVSVSWDGPSGLLGPEPIFHGSGVARGLRKLKESADDACRDCHDEVRRGARDASMINPKGPRGVCSDHSRKRGIPYDYAQAKNEGVSPRCTACGVKSASTGLSAKVDGEHQRVCIGCHDDSSRGKKLTAAHLSPEVRNRVGAKSFGGAMAQAARERGGRAGADGTIRVPAGSFRESEEAPTHNGETLSWHPGTYCTRTDQAAGHPKLRAVLHALKKHRPEQFAEFHTAARAAAKHPHGVGLLRVADEVAGDTR